MTNIQGNLFGDLPVYLGRVSKHPAHRVWCGMIQRCHNPKGPGFKNYGGRGIYVCDEWRASSRVFLAWAIKAGYRPGLELDRKDNDGPYSPDNCRFVTRLQNANNKRNNVRLSDGTTVPEVARQLGVSRDTLHMRIHRGMSPDEAAARPICLLGEGARGRFAPDGRALVDLAREHGIAPATLYARLDRGWSLQRALSAPLRQGHFLADGTPLVDAARAAGLNAETARDRIKRGMSPDEAVSIPLRAKRSAATARVALGESEAAAQGDKRDMSGRWQSIGSAAARLLAGMNDLPAVELPRPLTCPGYPAAWLSKGNGHA